MSKLLSFISQRNFRSDIYNSKNIILLNSVNFLDETIQY